MVPIHIANCPKSISFDDVSVHDGAHWQAPIRYSAVRVNQKLSGISHVRVKQSQESQEERRGGEVLSSQPTRRRQQKETIKNVLWCQLQLSLKSLNNNNRQACNSTVCVPKRHFVRKTNSPCIVQTRLRTPRMSFTLSAQQRRTNNIPPVVHSERRQRSKRYPRPRRRRDVTR